MCEIKEVKKKWENKRILFLSNIFPPSNKMIIQLKKQCVNLIWGTTRDMYKSKDYGGLGALELGVRLYIAFVKIISAAISRNALWEGDRSMWRKRNGRLRQGLEYKVIYGDCITQQQHLQTGMVY